MAITENPSIAMIPSGYKAGKVYSVLPTDGAGDLTFTRVGALPSYNATRVNENGLIEEVLSNVPRLDYTNGACPSLLLEPSRTNLFTYSEDFSQWTASDLTVTDNNAISPDGTLNASKLTAVSGTVIKRIQENGFSTTSTDRCYSIFVKTDDIKAIQLLHSGDLQGFARFDLVDYTVGSVGSKTTANIEDYGNGWYKCTAIFNSTNAFGSSLYLYFNDSAIGSYGGSSSQVGDLFIYGAQYEAGSYPTSYIPTQGSAVTRVADVCTNGGNEQVINSTEGVLYAEIKGFISTDTVEPNRYITVTNGTSNERVALLLGANPNQLRVIVYSNTQSINLSFTTSLTDVKQFNKLAVKYKSGDYAFFLNGTKIGSSSETSIFTANTFNDISFDVGGGTQQFRGKVKDLRLYNTALSDSELQALTTL